MAGAPPSDSLPIDEVVPALRTALAGSTAVVLQAPPGAGKTTRVPLALLNAPWLDGRRIVMLEPRRLATRAAARRMSSTLGESVGETVGFRVRGEAHVSARTRIEVVTEGILTRLLQDDPSLDGIGALLFDEFHERSLHADLGLALALESQALLRPELRIVVMSATLDVAAVAHLLGNAPVIVSEGRAFPVEVRHVPRRAEQYLDVAMSAAVRRALAETEGSVLVFLPGVGEIRSTMARLLDAPLPADVRVVPLFGDLSPTDQDTAIAPPPAGVRKVVLATSIAETSLTIEGVRVVVDSGESRLPSFSPRSGMTRLRTVRVSRAAAEQRRGRAGRTAPGVCYRLWAAEEHAALMERASPEILDADLAPLALDLARVGIVNPEALRWIDVPPAPALSQARALLVQLGALDERFRITAHGEAMSRLGTHPRLAHMLLRAGELGMGATACAVAALLEERDLLRRDAAARDGDLRSRIVLLASESVGRGPDVDHDARRRVLEQLRRWRVRLGVARATSAVEGEAGAVLSLAYPDRVARRRSASGHRYLLRGGLGAVLADPGTLAGAEFLAVAELDGQRPDARIFLAAPLDREDLDRLWTSEVVAEDVVEWSGDEDAVVAVRRERLGAILLREVPLRDASDDAVAEALLASIVAGGALALRWDAEATRLRERLAFLHRAVPAWPDVSDEALIITAREWLLPHLVGLRRKRDVDRLDLAALLRARLGWEQRASLDLLAPTHIEVPTGSRIRVDYADPAGPVLAVRLQELFGLATTPSIAQGAVPLTLHLLSPANRPVQVTRDLAGFWGGSYVAVRKELRGRYPKHEWPEDPMQATPTRRTKPRS